MRPQDRVLARKNIDKRLSQLDNLQSLARPPRGWIKAIREALGMTSRQFAERMGVSQPRASEIEKTEMSGSLTLDTLQRAAQALERRIGNSSPVEHQGVCVGEHGALCIGKAVGRAPRRVPLRGGRKRRL